MAVERMHEDIQELLGVYALDATDADETAMIDAHLATCPWCREELRQHREVAAVLASGTDVAPPDRSEEHTSELQSPDHLVCRLLLEKKKIIIIRSSHVQKKKTEKNINY